MLKHVIIAAAAALVVHPVQAAGQNPIRDSLREIYEITKTSVMATARELSAEVYGYRPTPDVRTSGQILAHIADAQYMFCSAAANESSPQTEGIEQSRTTKPQIVEALEQSFAYCDRVFASTSDAQGSRSVNLMGSPTTSFGALAFNTAHNYEHYGNLVTYMRLNDIVPPSSR
jgi:uncharacterized damage-inducible protein DinB